MTELRAARPLGLRFVNRLGGKLRTAGLPIVSLDPERLLARAQRRTQLEDFGDDAFRDGLARLVTALDTEAGLTILGRIIARTDLLRLLQHRLRLVDQRKQHPEIDREVIRAPIFILGLPRTGTSILHELLAQDPANRVPMTWEVMQPFPPPQRNTYESDSRIAEVDRHFAGIDRLIPNFKSMHPMGATLPQECVVLTQHEFASMVWHTQFCVPSYQAWLDGADLRPVYAGHRRWLQYFQWAMPAERWVLKSPGHLWALDALLAVYPDARIVQTHRDPVKVIASLVSLVCTLRSLGSDDIDPPAIAADWTARLADGLTRTMRVRDRAHLPAERVLDISLHEFMQDEIPMVRRMYDHFGFALSAEAEARMRRFLAANRIDKHGRHRYELSLGGLDETTERRRYAAYLERFAVPSEHID